MTSSDSSLDLQPPTERAAVIDHSAIAHNVSTIRSWTQPAEVMAVVKGDAYGHGMLPVARTALQAGATWLGTAHVTEALQLREAGIKAPLLAWLHTQETPFDQAIEQDIDLGISGHWNLQAVAEAAQRLERPARIHLKIDTGLGRNGCPPQMWDELCDEASRLEEEGLVRTVGVFSHLAVADEPARDAEVDAQLEVFHWAVDQAKEQGLSVEVRHIANSPATLTRPDCHLDMVRLGLSMYGLSPFEDRGPEEFDLRPAMSLRTTVASNKPVPKGQGISYGYRYHTEEPTRLALVPLGYADGVPRIAASARVWIDGVHYPIAGRIAMDQFVVDLKTLDPGVAPVGADVELFGPRSGISASEWASAAGTINYELVTRISPRVPRVHVNQDNLWGHSA